MNGPRFGQREAPAPSLRTGSFRVLATSTEMATLTSCGGKHHRRVVIWLMTGPRREQTSLGTSPRLVNSGRRRFQGDGKADILWRNSTTTGLPLAHEGTRCPAAGASATSPPDGIAGNWRFQRRWQSRHSVAQQPTGRSTWLMNGTRFASMGSPGIPPRAGALRGCDFDGRHDDILWSKHHRQIYIWFMNGPPCRAPGASPVSSG